MSKPARGKVFGLHILGEIQRQFSNQQPAKLDTAQKMRMNLRIGLLMPLFLSTYELLGIYRALEAVMMHGSGPDKAVAPASGR